MSKLSLERRLSALEDASPLGKYAPLEPYIGKCDYSELPDNLKNLFCEYISCDREVWEQCCMMLFGDLAVGIVKRGYAPEDEKISSLIVEAEKIVNERRKENNK